jgi:GNAT superfamily N-acetyltransferase
MRVAARRFPPAQTKFAARIFGQGVWRMSVADAAATIRPLGQADAEAYRRLRLEALQRHPEAFGASYAEEAARPLQAFAERIAPLPPSRVFGGFAGNELVGIAGFLSGTSPKSRHKGTLWGVYVAPSQRGCGLARRLVEAVIAHAAQHVVVLNANVVTSNATARTLYERLGFRCYGTEEKALCIDGVFRDEALLVLDFSAGA